MSNRNRPDFSPALVLQLQAAVELTLTASPTKKHPSSIIHRDVILDLLSLTHYLAKYPNLSLAPEHAPDRMPLPTLNEDFGPHTIATLQALIHQIDPHHPAGIAISSTSSNSISDSPEPDLLAPITGPLPVPDSVLYKDMASNYGRGVSHLAQSAAELFNDSDANSADSDPTQYTEPLHTQMIMGSDGKDHTW